MDVIGVTLAVLFGATLITAAGLPVVSRLAEARLRRRTYPDVYDPQRRPPLAQAPRAAPFELGPDPMRWPSEMNVGRPWTDALHWPSDRWEDDAFGRQAATAAAERARQEAEAARARAASERREKAVRALEAPAPGDLPTLQADAWGEPAAPPPRAEFPTPEEVRDLMRQLGLAGAMQELVQRTGLSLDEVTKRMLQQR